MREKLRTIACRLLAGQEGVALATVLLLTTVILSLGVSGSRSAQTELRIARNDLITKKALGIAEGGMNHAFGLIKNDAADGFNVGDFNDELNGGGSSGGTGGMLASVGSSATLGGDSYHFIAFGSGSSDGYYLRFEDNFDETTGTNVPGTDIDNTIKVISRGMASPVFSSGTRVSGAEKRVEGLIKIQTGPECAMTTQGALTISGNPELEGSNGCAHSNNDMTISGNPEFEAGPTSSGAMAISGNPEVEGTTLSSTSSPTSAQYAASHSSQPTVSIPSVRPFYFGSSGLNLATEVAALGLNGYRLDADCKVYRDDPASMTDSWTCTESPANCTGGTVVADLIDGGDGCSPSNCKWNDWDCSSDSSSTPAFKWELSGNTTIDGAFFVEGWVKISGNPGSSSTPWNATIIALNSIDISGNPEMTPFTTTGNLRNILLVSGNDIELSGNLAGSGAIFAHQQLKFSGNPELNGFVISEGGATTWTGDPAPSCSSDKDLLTCGTSSVSGNIEITYSGVDTALSPPTLKLMAWNEVRN